MRSLKTLVWGLGLISISAMAFASEHSRSGEVIGTWCDMQAAPSGDYVIEIWKHSEGGYSYHQLIRSAGKEELAHNSYAVTNKDGKWQIDNGHEEYAMDGADGALNIYDAYGLITIAKPVPPSTHPSDCRSINIKG